MEEFIMNRIQEISDEYAQLKELDKYDLTLEAIGEHGDVKVTLKKQGATFERTIKHNEPLGFISDTFFYPDTYSHNSKDISLNRLRVAYFNEFGKLVVERDDSTEVFRVQDRHREKVTEILKEKMGNKFKC
jgi:hypothetical protein